VVAFSIGWLWTLAGFSRDECPNTAFSKMPGSRTLSKM